MLVPTKDLDHFFFYKDMRVNLSFNLKRLTTWMASKSHPYFPKFQTLLGPPINLIHKAGSEEIWAAHGCLPKRGKLSAITIFLSPNSLHRLGNLEKDSQLDTVKGASRPWVPFLKQCYLAKTVYLIFWFICPKWGRKMIFLCNLHNKLNINSE